MEFDIYIEKNSFKYNFSRIFYSYLQLSNTKFFYTFKNIYKSDIEILLLCDIPNIKKLRNFLRIKINFSIKQINIFNAKHKNINIFSLLHKL
jgi:hypothetical protein